MFNNKVILNKSTILYIISIITFLLFNEIFYYLYYIDIMTYNTIGTSDLVNLHDHIIYLQYIRFIAEGQSLFVFGNNFGIASIYYVLGNIFDTTNYNMLSHYLNNLVYIFISIYVFKVFKLLKIPLILSIFFIFNPVNFYYLGLISKDSFTILIVLMFVYYLIKKEYYLFILLVLFSIIIRMQLPLFGLSLFFLVYYTNISNKKKIIFIYIISSIAAVLLTNTINIISEESMNTSLGIGITTIVQSLNKEYYIGSFLLNPIKIVQYFYDYSLAYKYIFSPDLFYFYRIKEFVNLIFLPISIFSIFIYLFFNKKNIDYGIQIFLLVIVSFFTVWLINPTVNYRYIGVFMPYILVSGLYLTQKLFRSKN